MTEENPMPEKKVDEDWKKRAADEKVKLQPAAKAAKVGAPEAQPAKAGEPAPATAEAPPEEAAPAGGRRRGGPFEMLVTMLVQQATMMLGLVADPMTGERYQDIGQARMIIDMLTTLKLKTKGNLSADEDRFLSSALGELQMEYVALAEEMQKRARAGGKPPRG
ncbi:MAG: hypothetical protein FD180_1409 [Planctomycetota bacterium]|nr:MAG: hypothetical protein FD180_1409 [Planctomycetota bacterium]